MSGQHFEIKKVVNRNPRINLILTSNQEKVLDQLISSTEKLVKFFQKNDGDIVDVEHKPLSDKLFRIKNFRESINSSRNNSTLYWSNFNQFVTECGSFNILLPKNTGFTNADAKLKEYDGLIREFNRLLDKCKNLYPKPVALSTTSTSQYSTLRKFFSDNANKYKTFDQDIELTGSPLKKGSWNAAKTAGKGIVVVGGGLGFLALLELCKAIHSGSTKDFITGVPMNSLFKGDYDSLQSGVESIQGTLFNLVSLLAFVGVIAIGVGMYRGWPRANKATYKQLESKNSSQIPVIEPTTTL